MGQRKLERRRFQNHDTYHEPHKMIGLFMAGIWHQRGVLRKVGSVGDVGSSAMFEGLYLN